jgi:hypothetical protein
LPRTALNTSLVAVRLERTRDVLRELLRSLKEALPIVAGVAGPIFIASVALLAWAGVPPMKAVTLPWRSGLALWLAQAVVAAWPLWALRRRLLPEAWCVQLRCLPFAGRTLWWTDVVVSAAMLAPLAVLYVLSVAVFAFQRPAWWLQALPLALLSLLASWAASCLLGASALAWQRRGVGARAVRALRTRSPEALLARRPRLPWALLWQPAWRGALTPGARSVSVGVVAAGAIAVGWTQAPWPAIPGAAWALAFCALLVALTERVQRAMESHLDGLGPWLAALPVSASWRWRARLLVCAPMVVAGLVAVALVLASRPWRGPPLAAFAIGVAVTPAVMTAVPSANREAHVGLWALCVGLLTALGSELWN